MKNFLLALKDEQYRKLKKISQRSTEKRITMSEIIRQAINKHLEAENGKDKNN